MELRQLRYFVAVAEELNFRRAAERLFISTPTLSQQIKAVEREVGAPLLLRHSRGAELTAAGHALLKASVAVLAAADEALREARRVAAIESQHRTEPTLRLGLLNGVPSWLPARFETLLQAEVTGSQIVLLGGPTAEQVRLLDAGETDLALLRGPVLLPAGLRQLPAAHEELGVLMSAESPLASAAAIDAADLAGRELILFPPELSPGFHGDVLRTLKARGANVVLSDSAMGFQQVLAILPLRPAAVSIGSARAAGTPGLAWRPFRGDPLIVTYVAAWRDGSRGDILAPVLRELARGALEQPR